MNSNLKPILEQIDQIKTKFNDPDFRAKVAENLQQTRATVEQKAKDVLIQARESRFVDQYVMPIIESEKTEQALQALKTRLGSGQIVNAIEKARQQLIDAKTNQAVAQAKSVSAQEENTVQ